MIHKKIKLKIIKQNHYNYLQLTYKSLIYNKNINYKYYIQKIIFFKKKKKQCLITNRAKSLQKKFLISRHILNNYLKKNLCQNLSQASW